MSWGAHKADVRIAAKNSVTMRAALRASINAQTIYEAYQETQPFVTDNNTQDRTRARAWAMLHVKINPEPIKAALIKIYADGFLLGLDASKEAVVQAVRQEKAKTKAIKDELLSMAAGDGSDYVDWNNWKPGNRAAALLYRPTGAFEKLLSDAGITSKKIAANGYDRIGTALADSIAAGFSPARAAKVITEKIGDPARALTIAITEQNRAMSLASMENYAKYGLEKIEWSGANPCDICAPNEGQVVTLGEPFNSGDTEPPVHPNCRCAVLPVIDEAFYADPNTSGMDLVAPLGATAEEATAEQIARMTPDEVMGYQREQGFFSDTVTEKQARAVLAYRGAEYSAMNEYLRTGQEFHGGVPFPTLKKYIDEVKTAINAAPTLPAPITTYRGVSGAYAETIGAYKPGTIYTDKGFTSTSLAGGQASFFAEYRNDKQFLKIEIDVPAGTKGLDMTGFFQARDPKTGRMKTKTEQEWLLPPKSKFEVVSNDGKTMKVRLIP